MRLSGNSRLAWVIALASVALWAATAPATLGSLGKQEADAPAESNPAMQSLGTTEPVPPQTAGELQCEAAPTPGSASSPDNATPSTAQPLLEATFRLCAGPDPQAERAIEQLIDGRSFRARLVSRADGCADLTISVSPQSSAGSFIGRQSTLLTVGSGSTAGVISVQIVTENGVTKASINGATTESGGNTPQPTPTATPTPPAAAPQSPQEGSSVGEATFRLCAGPDPQAERAIEQLIDGRSFRTRLVSRADGCAELTISVSPRSSAGSSSGRQSTQLTVSTGSGGVISLQIVTENGVTKATIGAAR